jgi:NADP-dependent 3-hydroxy acid dehydrogenase YdfG
MASRFDLSNKIALVTGGSRGLGRAMVLAFARAGADVVIASRKLEACEAVAREVEKLGRRALPVAAHVGKWEDNDMLAARAYDQFGRVDILVNNAGMSPLAPSLAETSEALFDKVVDVNFKGPFRLSVLVGERMMAGAGGAIINLSSIAAFKPGAAYGALFRRQGRGQCDDDRARQGIRAQGARELHSTRSVPDRRVGRLARQRKLSEVAGPRAFRRAGRDRRHRALSRERRLQLHDRRDHPRRWWDVVAGRGLE